MDYRKYLIDQGNLQLASVAKLMYPTNKGAHVYLSKKLNGDRPWTVKDNERARIAIQKIGQELIDLTTIPSE